MEKIADPESPWIGGGPPVTEKTQKPANPN
jgi:hypothetical protein